MFDQKVIAREKRRMLKNRRKQLGGLNHREAGACGKVGYDSRLTAVAVASSRLKSSTMEQDYLRPYLCPSCNEWHLTSKRPRMY